MPRPRTKRAEIGERSLDLADLSLRDKNGGVARHDDLGGAGQSAGLAYAVPAWQCKLVRRSEAVLSQRGEFVVHRRVLRSIRHRAATRLLTEDGFDLRGATPLGEFRFGQSVDSG